MRAIVDNFSGASADYARFRPGPPEEVFSFIYEHVREWHTAWDVGTGNGQVAVRLSDRFGHVIGTDISEQQLSHAIHRSNIEYRLERAELTTLEAQSIDLVTVAQAIHWFDFDAFYREVERVCKASAFFAAWTYSTLKLSPAVNEVIDYFYDTITGPYWDKERAFVDLGYKTIPFPFREVTAPEIYIVKQYSIEQLVAYLRTWSGVRHYIEKVGNDPLALIIGDLEKAWGSEELLEVRWPIHVRAGYVNV